MRKIFLLFPAAILIISISNLLIGDIFRALIWLFTTILVSTIAFPLAFKTNEKVVPLYQIFVPTLSIPVFFSIFAIMDFSRLDFLNQPQAIVYGIFSGILFLGALFLIIGPSKF